MRQSPRYQSGSMWCPLRGKTERGSRTHRSTGFGDERGIWPLGPNAPPGDVLFTRSTPVPVRGSIQPVCLAAPDELKMAQGGNG